MYIILLQVKEDKLSHDTCHEQVGGPSAAPTIDIKIALNAAKKWTNSQAICCQSYFLQWIFLETLQERTGANYLKDTLWRARKGY